MSGMYREASGFFGRCFAWKEKTRVVYVTRSEGDLIAGGGVSGSGFSGCG